MASRDHAIVSPRFWNGETGRFLRQYPDAQRLALYLMTCPSSNMIGLYYLPLPVVCHELGLPLKGASEALRRVIEGGFASYDEASEVVFVHEMARFQVGESLDAKDNRVKAVRRQLLAMRKSLFYQAFIDRYGEAFKLENLPPFEGASKPLRSQDQDQGQEKGQDQGQGCVAAADRGGPTRFTPPAVGEVAAYCRERGNAVDPEKFVDFYASKGWLVGKNRMKDWKAAVRTWEKNGAARPGPSTLRDQIIASSEAFLNREDAA